MTATDLHDHDLEDRLRTVLHGHAESITGPPPALDPRAPASGLRPATSGGGGARRRRSRRLLAGAVAAGLLGAGITAALVRDHDGDRTSVSSGPTSTAPDGDAPAGEDPSGTPDRDTRPIGEVEVLVLNGATGPGLAGGLTSVLADAGYGTVPASNADATTTATAVHFAPGYEADARALAERLGLAADAATALPPGGVGPGSSDVDVVVVLGDAWDPTEMWRRAGPSSTPATGDEVTSLPIVEPVIAPDLALDEHGAWVAEPADGVPVADAAVGAARAYLGQVFAPDLADDVPIGPPYDLGAATYVDATLPGGAVARIGVKGPDDAGRYRVQPWGGATTTTSSARPGGTVGSGTEVDVPAVDGAVAARLWYRAGANTTWRLDLGADVIGVVTPPPAGLPADEPRTRIFVPTPVQQLSALVVAYLDADGRVIALHAIGDLGR